MCRNISFLRSELKFWQQQELTDKMRNFFSEVNIYENERLFTRNFCQQHLLFHTSISAARGSVTGRPVLHWQRGCVLVNFHLTLVRSHCRPSCCRAATDSSVFKHSEVFGNGLLFAPGSLQQHCVCISELLHIYPHCWPFSCGAAAVQLLAEQSFF